MAISWGRTAAGVLCGLCAGAAAAASGVAGPTAIPPAVDIASEVGWLVTPTIEPAVNSASVQPPAVMHLRLPEQPLTLANPLPETNVPRIRRVPARPSAGAQHRRTAPLVLAWPSRGIVTSRFGWRTHPIFGGREFHTGLDIAAHSGTPVVAARAGVVRFVGWKTGYGRIVIVEHDDGLETAYSHLSSACVGPGDGVVQGQAIGRVGSTGWSTGPHLLFEVRRDGIPVDPSPYLN